MAAEFPSKQSPSVRGGVVVEERVYVDADGNRVSATSTAPKRLYAPPGATLSESEAKRLGVTTSEEPEPAEESQSSEEPVVLQIDGREVARLTADEEATAEGESVKPKDGQFVCACGYEAKSNAGLSAHQRACEDSG